MTESFENLLYLLGTAASGKETVPVKNINVEEIRKYAIQQGVWTIIYDKLQALCDVSAYKKEFLSIMAKSIGRSEYTSYILGKLEENGVECCLLKGNTVARLYNQPDLRVSSDADILIRPEDEEKTASILVSNGYTVEARNVNDHHMKAHHPIGGLLEAHVRLYSHMTEQVIFNGLNMYSEPYMSVEINGKSCKTLGVNDGLMYLTAHYLKHFINSGGGIRQMMDLLLYIEHYKNEIDFDNYYKVLEELRYEKVIRVVMSIGAKYFGFDYEITDEKLMQKILDDTEKGGIFGFSANDRKGFYDKYCSKRTNWSQIKYNTFKVSKSETSFLCKIFPARQTMERLGYKDKLLIVSWFKRVCRFAFKRISPKTKVRTSGIDARMQLMQELNMID